MSKHSMRLLKTNWILIVLLAGCAQHAYQVRDAQDIFSRGAGLDLARKFNMNVPEVDDPLQESHRYYALAVGTINEAIRDGAADLKRDDLYGTALTIKALSLWRLGETDASKEVADEVIALAASNSNTSRIWPRDLGICKSLPVLFKIDALADQAREFVAQAPNNRRQETINRIMADAEQTETELNNIVNAPFLEGHPFQFFLAEARCEIANILQEAAAATADFEEDVRKKYYKRYNDYRNKVLQNLLDVVTDHDLGEGFKARASEMHVYYSRILVPLPAG